MRIIAGKFRRRKLLPPPGSTTRPITDRAKEILFQRLSGRLEGCRVADVFAGTGSLGLEALSRGSAGVVFIENDRQAFERLQRNVAALNVEDAVLCWRTDGLRTSFRPKGVPELLPYDLVFFDPPYRMIADLRPQQPIFKALERLARQDVTGPEALLVLRTPQTARFELPAAWQARESIDISSMSVHLIEKASLPND